MNSLRTATAPTARHDSDVQAYSSRSVGHGWTQPREEFGIRPSDHAFAALRAAYQDSGGVVRGDDLARTLWDRQRSDYVSLARLIASGEILSFKWRESLWMPMFQFEPGELTIKPSPRQVLGEFGNVFDGWSVAAWFVQPCSWLDDRRPVDRLDCDLAAVLDAARADRFIATG